MDLTLDNRPGSIDSDDESDIGIRRQHRAMKTRLAELELLYSTRFRFQVPTAITEAESKHGPRCGLHRHVVVSMRTPLVRCAQCGESLDALDVLREFTREERTFAFALEHLRQERSDLAKEVAALKKQRQNLRNAVRKAGGKPVERWNLGEED